MGRWGDRYEWDYYSESQPRHVEGGIKTKNERGAIGETWWSKRWIRVLESFSMGTRLTRGRSYARRGQVLSLDIQPGIVKARVQGSLREPYKIKIQLQPLSQQEWDRVTEAMATQALFAAKLLAGEMPNTIEEAFSTVHLSLFPTTEDDLQTACSCPDWANPCKHIAAVYYILAEHFDEDPFLIFKLRGRSKDEIIDILRKKRLATLPAEHEPSPQETSIDTNAPMPEASLRLEAYIESFWQPAGTLSSFSVHPHTPRVDKAVIKRLGDSPFSIGQQNIASLVTKAYDLVDQAVAARDAQQETLTLE